MEEEGLLDPTNEIHLFSLHYVMFSLFASMKACLNFVGHGIHTPCLQQVTIRLFNYG